MSTAPDHATAGRRRSSPRPGFDPLDPEIMRDPYPTYERLRAAGPLCRVGPASWGVTRHADVAALLRDPRLSNSLPENDPQFATQDGVASTVFDRIIPTQDPDGHGLLHELMVRAFSPGVARATRPYIDGLLDAVMERARASGRLDAVADLAFPVAASVVCKLIGMPPETHRDIWPRVPGLSKAFTPFLPEADRSGADAALVWLRSTVADLLEQRRAQPESDLLSSMLAEVAKDGSGLTVEAVIDNLAFLCFTGFETTMNMVATGCAALAREPEHLARLRADPQLVPTAVEEFIRFDAPIQYTARLASEPIQVGERTIRPGRPVFLLLGCANHDEAVFAEPDRIDIGRSPNPHVGFGGGVRGCFGVALARVEGAAVFSRLAAEFTDIQPAGEFERLPSALFRTYRSVPMAVR
ncbi:cytochrome P450 [Salinactinospora qingdaonensis]|uniref:Cytochrome P450 n=1 Tax=Salinactinospora qingdaonensis TaxID=702744 RepID=A0ABP7FA36_9ACTN